MKSLAILGAGGHGKVVADAAVCAGWNDVVFFDDGWPQLNQVEIWKVVGNTALFMANLDRFDGIIIAIGDNLKRYRMIMDLVKRNIALKTIIHPSAVVSRLTKIGEGSVVFANAVVNPSTQIGNGVIINTAATVDHDCKLGDGVHLSPGVHLGGGVEVGNLTWIGLGASVRHKIKLGSQVMVGAGAAVVCDVPDNVQVVGVPAKVIKRLREDPQNA